MKDFGFQLRCLRVTSNTKSSEVDFTPGLNVIAGLSNTGKSYIRQCIDFGLGGSKLPEELPEARNYERILLGIETVKQSNFTLQRSLGGGDFFLYPESLSSISFRSKPSILKAKAEPGPGNVSSFLLGLSGIKPTKLRYNAQNETKNLTFHSIVHLFVIDESEIISERSLILRDDFNNTKLKAAFNYLITGQDDSSLIASPKKEIVKAQLEARKDVLDELIGNLERELGERELSGIELDKEISAVQAEVARLKETIAGSSAKIFSIQESRKDTWEERSHRRARIAVIEGLLKRFDLLEKHYDSDLSRLDFVQEGGHYLEHLQTVNCPLCGSSVDAHLMAAICSEQNVQSVDIAEACRLEAAKIRTLQADLAVTIQSLRSERDELSNYIESQNAEITKLDDLLAGFLRPKEIAERSQLDKLIASRGRLSDLESANNQLILLRRARAELDNPVRPKVEKTVSRGLDTVALRELSDVVENILRDWKFTDAGIVEFNEQRMDILVGGKPRQSNGKGVRALMHSAFAIALMRYCKTKNLPHPGWVLLDSPLTSFREGSAEDADEELSGEIQHAFFRSLSDIPRDEQIIVLENKEPPSNLRSKMNYISFGGIGRRGFFVE